MFKGGAFAGNEDCSRRFDGEFFRVIALVDGDFDQRLASDFSGQIQARHIGLQTGIVDRQFHQGALFPYRDGFGVLFADVLHVWDSLSATPRTVEVLNPVAQRDIAPISAATVPDRDETVVLLDDDLYTGSGRFIARMHLAAATAAWLGQPRDLAYDDFRGAAVQPYPHPQSDRLFPEITDLVAPSSTSIRVHAVGKPGGHAREFDHVRSERPLHGRA